MWKFCNPDKIAANKYASRWGHDGGYFISKAHYNYLISCSETIEAHKEYRGKEINELESQLDWLKNCNSVNAELESKIESLTDECVLLRRKYSDLYEFQNKEDRS